jgi:hypothetical protein
MAKSSRSISGAINTYAIQDKSPRSSSVESGLDLNEPMEMLCPYGVEYKDSMRDL